MSNTNGWSGHVNTTVSMSRPDQMKGVPAIPVRHDGLVSIPWQDQFFRISERTCKWRQRRDTIFPRKLFHAGEFTKLMNLFIFGTKCKVTDQLPLTANTCLRILQHFSKDIFSRFPNPVAVLLILRRYQFLTNRSGRQRSFLSFAARPHFWQTWVAPQTYCLNSSKSDFSSFFISHRVFDMTHLAEKQRLLIGQ